MSHDFHPLTIAQVRQETPEALSLALRVPDAQAADFRFKPGQHLVLRRMLDAAHEVVISDSAEAALRMLQARAEFDAIICDVMMPTMDGVAFYREVLESIPQLASRIVFLSGGVKAEQEAKFFSTIPNLALQKPPNARELLRAIESQLVASRRGTLAN